MSYQKCPNCDGCGYVGMGFPVAEECSVCDGWKIISEQTGFPPRYKILISRDNFDEKGMKINKKYEKL